MGSKRGSRRDGKLLPEDLNRARQGVRAENRHLDESSGRAPRRGHPGLRLVQTALRIAGSDLCGYLRTRANVKKQPQYDGEGTKTVRNECVVPRVEMRTLER
jgi:hypothetical protein